MRLPYTIIMSIEATVTVWKENIHSAVDRSFTVRGKVRDQVSFGGRGFSCFMRILSWAALLQDVKCGDTQLAWP